MKSGASFVERFAGWFAHPIEKPRNCSKEMEHSWRCQPRASSANGTDDLFELSGDHGLAGKAELR
jgi:hypothetical protein